MASTILAVRYAIDDQALERGEFALHYQPQFDVQSGSISGPRFGERISTGFVESTINQAHCEALREETANAMDASRRTLTTAGASARPQ